MKILIFSVQLLCFTCVDGFLRRKLEEESTAAYCLRQLGKEGQWIEDVEFAERAQYDSPIINCVGSADREFREKRASRETSLKYRPATTFRWQDAAAKCPLELMNRDNLCHVLGHLGIKRVFFLGDSLSMEQALSMWMLMKPPTDTPLKDQSSLEHHIECPSGFSFQISYVRNDELIETDQPVSMPDSVYNCGDNRAFCYPWHQAYLKDPSRTLLMVNTGAHLKDPSVYHRAIHSFFHSFDSFQRENDLVFIRTQVPGHLNCHRHGAAPFSSITEYHQDLAAQGGPHKNRPAYNVTNQQIYNSILSQSVAERNLQSSSKGVMYILDIFPSTILRADGHMGSEFKAEATKEEDCLHYSLPGPVDWWNHLLFSHLLQIIQMRQAANEQSAS